MNGPKSLAAILNRVSDDDFATISDDDAQNLYEGLSPHAGDPEVDAALARLRGHICHEDCPMSPSPRRLPPRELH